MTVDDAALDVVGTAADEVKEVADEMTVDDVAEDETRVDEAWSAEGRRGQYCSDGSTRAGRERLEAQHVGTHGGRRRRRRRAVARRVLPAVQQAVDPELDRAPDLLDDVVDVVEALVLAVRVVGRRRGGSDAEQERE